MGIRVRNEERRRFWVPIAIRCHVCDGSGNALLGINPDGEGIRLEPCLVCNRRGAPAFPLFELFTNEVQQDLFSIDDTAHWAVRKRLKI